MARRAASTASSPQAWRQRSSTSGGKVGASGSATPRAASVPSTPCTSRRGPPSTKGRAVATRAWSGVPRPAFWASARRSTMRALLSSGRFWRVAESIKASRSGRRRRVSPAMATASAASGGGSLIFWPTRHRASGPGAARHRAMRARRGAHRGLRPQPSLMGFGAPGRTRSSAASSTSSVARGPASRSIDGGDDRHVDAALVGDPPQHRRGEGAFRHRPAVGHQLGDRAALADRLAEREIARAGRGAGQHEVAEPGQAGQGFEAGAMASPKRVISAKPRAIRAARAFWPRPRPRRRRRRWRARS